MTMGVRRPLVGCWAAGVIDARAFLLAFVLILFKEIY